MSEYTKGPWKVVGSGETLFVDGPMDANIDPIEDVRHSIATVTGPDRVANAQLLAASHELLEALKRAYAWMEKIDSSHQTDGIPMGLEDLIVAVIAKAEATNGN